MKNNSAPNIRIGLSFALVMFVPVIITTVFFIVYFGGKIEEEALRKINSDSKTAQIMFQNAVDEMKNLANIYARQKIVVLLIQHNLGIKIGNQLATYALSDNIDMITIIDASYKVLVRSHAPEYINGTQIRLRLANQKKEIDEALGGISVSGIERISRKDLEEEGFDVEKNLPADTENILVITGVVPIYDRDGEKIVGVLIARRILNQKSEFIRTISKTLNTDVALFENIRPIAWKSLCNTDNFVISETEPLRKVLNLNTPVHSVNISKGGSIAKYLPLTDFTGTPVGVLMIRACAKAYLRTRNIAIGILFLILLSGCLFTVAIKRIIEKKLTAYHIALKEEIEERRKAEEHIRRMHQKMLKVQENERRRIAMDLHDHIIQNLSALIHKYEIAFYQNMVSEKIKKRVIECNSMLKENIGYLRNLVYGLRPSGLEQFGLADTLEIFCRDFMNETHITVDFSYYGAEESEIDDDTGISLFRVVQEAFSNIRKHSEATRVRVRLVTSYPNMIFLSISDNGKGFDMNEVLNSPSYEKRMGISGMTERVRYLNGTIRIKSFPGKGTEIELEIGN